MEKKKSDEKGVLACVRSRTTNLRMPSFMEKAYDVMHGIKTVEAVIMLMLCSCMAVVGGVTFCLGLMETIYVNELHIPLHKVSFLNSITFSVSLLPAPVILYVRTHFNLKHYVIFASVGPLMGTGLLLNSFAKTYLDLVLSNWIFLLPGIALALPGCLTTVYSIFPDSKVPFIMAVVNSGVGMGIALFAMLFENLKNTIGWQNCLRVEFSLVIVYPITALLLYPPIRHRFTHSPTEHRIKTTTLMVRKSTKNFGSFERPASGMRLPSSQMSSSDSAAMEDMEIQSKNGSKRSTNGSYITVSFTTTNSYGDSSSQKSWVKAVINFRFFLLCFSHVLAQGTYNAVMMHQAQRMVFNGHTINNGASTLVYNGLIQMFSRFVVGPLAASGIVSVIRMSEIAKLFFMVFTVLSNIFTSYNFHSIYMLIVGLGGGMLSTCDFILVKDCMGEGRELGVTILLLIEGLSSFVFISSTGFFFDSKEGFKVAFYIFAFAMGTSLALVIILDFILNCPSRRRDPSSTSISIRGPTRDYPQRREKDKEEETTPLLINSQNSPDVVNFD